MPEINITMDGEAVAVNITSPLGYTDSGAVANALDGETINPAVTNTQELSVSDVLDAPSYPTQSDLPADRPVGFIALIEDENRIYFEGA